MRPTITVPIINAAAHVPSEIRLTIDSDHEFQTSSHGLIDYGEWKLLEANPAKYYGWLQTALFNNSGFEQPFVADVGRVNGVGKCFETNPLDSGLYVTLVVQEKCGVFTFIDGRHRAYYLAIKGAQFVPLMVPVVQYEIFAGMLL